MAAVAIVGATEVVVAGETRRVSLEASRMRPSGSAAMAVQVGRQDPTEELASGGGLGTMAVRSGSLGRTRAGMS